MVNASNSTSSEKDSYEVQSIILNDSTDKDKKLEHITKTYKPFVFAHHFGRFNVGYVHKMAPQSNCLKLLTIGKSNWGKSCFCSTLCKAVNNPKYHDIPLATQDGQKRTGDDRAFFLTENKTIQMMDTKGLEEMEKFLETSRGSSTYLFNQGAEKPNMVLLVHPRVKEIQEITRLRIFLKELKEIVPVYLIVTKEDLDQVHNSTEKTMTAEEIAKALDFGEEEFSSIENITVVEERSSQLEGKALDILWKIVRRAEVVYSNRNQTSAPVKGVVNMYKNYPVLFVMMIIVILVISLITKFVISTK